VVDGLGQLASEKAEARAEHASTLRERACSGGAGASCFEMAEHIRATDAESIERTRKLARACELGVPAACLQQGDRAWQQRDAQVAESSYGRACELGMKSACKDLARMYELGAMQTGRGVVEPWPQNDEKAARFRALAGSLATNSAL
jgi:TPR repeat protein